MALANKFGTDILFLSMWDEPQFRKATEMLTSGALLSWEYQNFIPYELVNSFTSADKIPVAKNKIKHKIFLITVVSFR